MENNEFKKPLWKIMRVIILKWKYFDFHFIQNFGAKSLRIRFDKIDEFIRIYDRSRYSISFGPEKYDATYKRIRYFMGVKSGIIYMTLEWSKLIYTSRRNVEISCYNTR